jgi:hypothetical protein
VRKAVVVVLICSLVAVWLLSGTAPTKQFRLWWREGIPIYSLPNSDWVCTRYSWIILRSLPSMPLAVWSCQSQYSHSYSNWLDRDIALYHSTIENWKISALAEPFELLRELGNVFIVKYIHTSQMLLICLGRIFFVRYFVKGCWQEFNHLFSDPISNSGMITIHGTCTDWWVGLNSER